jgi:P-type E1-E2 ATPase
VITFLIWLLIGNDLYKAANYAICVLVISCPCSLGLATPVAVMAATGKGMSLGILYKDAEVLQKAKDIKSLAFSH